MANGALWAVPWGARSILDWRQHPSLSRLSTVDANLRLWYQASTLFYAPESSLPPDACIPRTQKTLIAIFRGMVCLTRYITRSSAFVCPRWKSILKMRKKRRVGKEDEGVVGKKGEKVWEEEEPIFDSATTFLRFFWGRTLFGIVSSSLPGKANGRADWKIEWRLWL